MSEQDMREDAEQVWDDMVTNHERMRRILRDVCAKALETNEESRLRDYIIGISWCHRDLIEDKGVGEGRG